METQQAQVATLSGCLSVTVFNDMNIKLNVIEFVFNGTEKELWQTACVKFQELHALGLIPLIQFKDRKGIRQLQINAEDIDMIMSM